jgi:hypothetical protein
VGYREQARAQLIAQEGARRKARREGVRYQVQPVTFSFPAPGKTSDILGVAEK